MFSKIRTTKTASWFSSICRSCIQPLAPGPRPTLRWPEQRSSGTVSDQSGGVLPQAAISIKNTATGITAH